MLGFQWLGALVLEVLLVSYVRKYVSQKVLSQICAYDKHYFLMLGHINYANIFMYIESIHITSYLCTYACTYMYFNNVVKINEKSRKFRIRIIILL